MDGNGGSLKKLGAVVEAVIFFYFLAINLLLWIIIFCLINLPVTIYQKFAIS